jgi:threonine synthase
MLGFQAAGAAPIVEGRRIDRPETVATAIRIGNPASWSGALTVVAESGGAIAAVTDDEILDAYRLLAEEESVFCEPASAAAVAGLLKAGVPADSKVVCVLTGNGLKDPDVALASARPPEVVEAALDSVLGALKLPPVVGGRRRQPAS